MKQPPVKLHWITRCVEVHNFHVAQLKEESNWTVEKTAKALNRSVGSVSEDLLVASWLRTHEKQLKRFKCMKDALEFVRLRKKEMHSKELEL